MPPQASNSYQEDQSEDTRAEWKASLGTNVPQADTSAQTLALLASAPTVPQKCASFFLLYPTLDSRHCVQPLRHRAQPR
jgi:hypothetical protein